MEVMIDRREEVAGAAGALDDAQMVGIESAKIMIEDFNGRPAPIVDHGKPIPELIV
jgi:hypothetical protein